VSTEKIEPIKPPVGSCVAMMFRVTGYDPDCGETPETASMARLEAVDMDGETTGWEVNCVGLYNTTSQVIEMPARKLLVRDMGTGPVDEYAHELAERLRTTMRAPGGSYDASRWNRVVDTLADELDPYVTG
jgi:hypothetical protein